MHGFVHQSRKAAKPAAASRPGMAVGIAAAFDVEDEVAEPVPVVTVPVVTVVVAPGLTDSDTELTLDATELATELATPPPPTTAVSVAVPESVVVPVALVMVESSVEVAVADPAASSLVDSVVVEAATVVVVVAAALEDAAWTVSLRGTYVGSPSTYPKHSKPGHKQFLPRQRFRPPRSSRCCSL